MATTTAGGATTAEFGRTVVKTRSQGRLFFTLLPAAMFLVVIVGFAPTYYLKTAFGTPALPVLYHVHGAAFTAWMLLLILQPALVASGRTPLHRKLGVVGGVLAAVMTVLAFFVAIDLGRRGGGPPGVPPAGFTAVTLFTVVVFPAFVGAALWWRQFPATHKRLMMIATMELLPAGVGRWPGVADLGPLGFFGGADLALIALLVYDRVTTGRFHRATVWGGALLVASQVVRVVLAFNEGWQAFARSLIG
jgi:hypothetical protein